jgi:hypothetical protein
MPKLLSKSPACRNFQDQAEVAELQKKVIQALPMKRSPGCEDLQNRSRLSELWARRYDLHKPGVTPASVALEEVLRDVSCRVS